MPRAASLLMKTFCLCLFLLRLGASLRMPWSHADPRGGVSSVVGFARALIGIVCRRRWCSGALVCSGGLRIKKYYYLSEKSNTTQKEIARSVVFLSGGRVDSAGIKKREKSARNDCVGLNRSMRRCRVRLRMQGKRSWVVVRERVEFEIAKTLRSR